jgi:phosphoribosyl 1,2-cyclic phosphate phosphodiesterase
MKIRFLGTGTSTGNPEPGCCCEVCTSSDSRDKRFRTSVLVETEGKRILIDCGPDFRMQILEALKKDCFTKLDGVLLTHEHYDHMAGLDDLRTFCRNGAVDIYAESSVVKSIRKRLDYVFRKDKYPGVPDLSLHEIQNKPFDIAEIEIIPIRLMHGNLPIFGYRIENFAFLTDLKTIPESEYGKLKNLDFLVINALRPSEHISHQNIESALFQIKKINPNQAYLIHMSHQFGLHSKMEKEMPENVFIACDGLEISN